MSELLKYTLSELCEEVEEYRKNSLHNYDCGLKVNITDVCFYGNEGEILRAIYWVRQGELRSYDVLYDKYKENVRDKKLRRIGI